MRKVLLIISMLLPIAVSLKAQTATAYSSGPVWGDERSEGASIASEIQNDVHQGNSQFSMNGRGQHIQKKPITVTDAPTIFNNVQDPYRSYAPQGNAMYMNNSMFYNKDNFMLNANPIGNGHYTTPGNSNPINSELYREPESPSGTIYSGYIPVREY